MPLLCSLSLVLLVPAAAGALLQGQADGPEVQAPTTAPSEALLDHKRLTLALQRLASEHTELVSVLSVGHSRSGRIFEALRIARGEISAGRPALLIVANLECGQTYTSALAIELARNLVERAATDERVALALDRSTIYIIPRANPDGAEARFARPLFESDATGQGIDDDRDGRQGEDPPADLNGDGQITWIRLPSSEGDWLMDPLDPRAMIRSNRTQGDAGQFKLFVEGRDLDRDEAAAEDAQWNARINRNFPQDWPEHAGEGGLFPTDEPETRALCEFLLAKKDIQLVLTLGEHDLLVEKHKSVSAKPAGESGIPVSGVLEQDDALLLEIGKRWAKIARQPAKGNPDLAGSLAAWCYAQRGLMTIALKPWTIPLDEKPKKDEANAPADPLRDGMPENSATKPERELSEDAKRLVWIDANPDATMVRFVPWSPYQHPELGAVEIGGFAPFGLSEPPAGERARLTKEIEEFVLALESMLARVTIEDAKIQEVAPGLIEVRAAVVNRSYLPLLSEAGKRAEALRGAKIELFLPKEATILAGKRQELISDLPGSGGRREFRWLVQGGSIQTIGVSVSSDHAGLARYQESK